MSARDASGSAPQHSHPHNNTMSRNEKFWVDQVTVPHPPPPPGNDKGWGTTRGGGGYDRTVLQEREGDPSNPMHCGPDPRTPAGRHPPDPKVAFACVARGPQQSHGLRGGRADNGGDEAMGRPSSERCCRRVGKGARPCGMAHPRGKGPRWSPHGGGGGGAACTLDWLNVGQWSAMNCHRRANSHPGCRSGPPKQRHNKKIVPNQRPNKEQQEAVFAVHNAASHPLELVWRLKAVWPM